MKPTCCVVALYVARTEATSPWSISLVVRATGALAAVTLRGFYGIMGSVNEPEGMKHIGLNAHLLSLSRSYRGAGTHAYIGHLLDSLPGADPSLRYTAFIGDRRYSTVSPLLELRGSRLPTQYPAVRILWEQLLQPLAIGDCELDLLHGMAFVGPLVSTCPLVVTVLDLSFLHYPQAFRPANRLYLRLFTQLSARRATRLIAISQHTKADVVRWLNIAPERVDVVHCGVDDRYQPLPPEMISSFRREKALPEQYLLHVGTLEPRKNQGILLRVYARLRDVGAALPPLLIVGGRGWLYQDLFSEVERLNLQDSVHFAGYVPAAELPLWYNGATCFLYPSLYEGFGLPPLEAMACGTPVLSSNAASLPEVIEDGGLLLAPLDEEQWADGLMSVLARPELREELRQRGRRRALAFDWSQAAEATTRVYRSALAGATDA